MPISRRNGKRRNRERFCEGENPYGQRCNEPVHPDEVIPFCRAHWPRPSEMVAKDVGPRLDSRVYFALAAENEVVKIGTTRNLTKRIKSLTHASPTPLFLLGSIEGGLCVERWFHRYCLRDRSHLEWFFWTPRVCEVVDRALRYGDHAARFMCAPEYQTDRQGERWSDIKRMPGQGRR